MTENYQERKKSEEAKNFDRELRIRDFKLDSVWEDQSKQIAGVAGRLLGVVLYFQTASQTYKPISFKIYFENKK